MAFNIPAALKKFHITGLGLSVFDRLGVEDLLPQYSILTLKKSLWVENFPNLSKKVHTFSDYDSSVSEDALNTTSILQAGNWKKIIEELKTTHLLTYKPISNKDEFVQKFGASVLANDYTLFKTFENKARIRELLGKRVSFPAFVIQAFSKLETRNFDIFFQNWGEFVIQDTVLSGGRGTFFIKTKEEYQKALDFLKSKNSQEVVISQKVAGISCSIQACITKYGIFMMPPQKQIINQAILTNASDAGSEKFNGGQWSTSDFSTQNIMDIKEQTKIIGETAQKLGYKGIFGIDFILGEDNRISIIEMNARLTGMTAVITSIQRSLQQTRFMLLHILELSKQEYELSPQEVSDISHYTFGEKDYSYLILHNNQKSAINIQETIHPGIYNVGTNEIEFVEAAYNLEKPLRQNQVLLVDFPQKNEVIPKNKHLGRILTSEKVLDSDGNLTEKWQTLVSQIKKKIEKS